LPASSGPFFCALALHIFLNFPFKSHDVLE
jgi:hypothetical protein